MRGRPLRAVVVVLLLAGLRSAAAGEAAGPRAYFPLGVGNWWAYEELDVDGKPLSRETWTILGAPAAGAAEFHLHSLTKRLDELGHTGNHFEGDEYLRITTDGVSKRYPAGRGDAELEVTLLKEPIGPGTSWHDAQGDCDARAERTCGGPSGDLADCAVVVCRLGRPTSTVVTSTYARGIGMVRQELDVMQLLPTLHGSGAPLITSDGVQGGHSLLRLTGFHVAGDVSGDRSGSRRGRAAPRRDAAARPD